MKSRIVFLGSRELGYNALEWLIENDRFSIVGIVLAANHGKSYPYSKFVDLAEEHSLDIIDLDDLTKIEFDIGVSVNYDRLVHRNILELPLRGFWNVHHSYNLRLRGRNITTHAILNSKREQIHYHGTSLHQMAPELDSGGIVASNSVEIREDDTAYTLFKKVDHTAFELFKEWIPRIAFDQVYPYAPPSEGIHMYKAKDMPSNEIPEHMPEDQIYDYVRAFDFPGFPPAYMYRGSSKVELVIIEREEYNKKVTIADKNLYTNSLGLKALV